MASGQTSCTSTRCHKLHRKAVSAEAEREEIIETEAPGGDIHRTPQDYAINPTEARHHL